MPSLVQTLTTITVNYNKFWTIATKLQLPPKKNLQLHQIPDNYNKITITKKKLTDNYNNFKEMERKYR